MDTASDRPASQTDMIPTKTRSRSDTATSIKSRRRPQSRASTTSIHSVATQQLEQLADPGLEYNKEWYESGQPLAHQQPHRGYPQMSPDAMVFQTQLQNQREYGLDPALGAAVNHSLGYPQDPQYNGQHPQHVMQKEQSYGEEDSQLLGNRSEEQDEVDSLGPNGAPKKASKSSAANELEMRQLFQANKNRSLPDVARELHGNERGPQSERTRQVFAMLWINLVCDKGKGSVPRGRVYANYVSRCATERVTVLNPASFGKLVRVLFPGLKTRRLGVRGESKYHYVNFSLKEDQADIPDNPVAPAVPNFETPRFSHTLNSASMTSDRAVFPSPGLHTRQPEAPSRQPQEGLIKPTSLYHQPDVTSLHTVENTTGKMPQRLRFAAPSEISQEYEPISLPKIEPFVPPNTDPDSASALTALYRSHCTSLVECIRFCKEKTFFHLFTSFHGTLTMPVQKLFANPAIAPWIEECDFIMYQKMMRVVAPLTLQVAPKPVLDTLRNISERLVPHIRDSFQGHPAHVIAAKIAPATLFAGLLDRELRVNLTAHAAANMLANPGNRDQMYEDWITMVRPRKVAECVPTRGMDDVVMLLVSEMRDLLDPTAVPWEIEGPTIYGEMAMRNGRQAQANIHADSTTENVLDRWVAFLTSLPTKFPYASHAEIVWCVQRVGTSAMRDLTLQQGQSFGAWWVTKCWLDEMISFMAEQGGFMDYKTSKTSHRDTSTSQQQIHQKRTSQSGGRYNSNDGFSTGGMGGDNNGVIIHGPNGGSTGPMDAVSQAAMNAAAGHDDSGISMRTPDDDYPMGKFGFVGTDGGMVVGNGLHMG